MEPADDKQEDVEASHRELHPGSASDGKRFKLLELNFTLGGQ